MGKLRIPVIVTGKFIFWQLANLQILKQVPGSAIFEPTVGNGFLQMASLDTFLFSKIGDGTRNF